jgi:aryl-alcohol dehydrogenase-like predicted oxidoreductase
LHLRLGSRLGVTHGESLAERFDALARLREEGLIRHLGLGNVDAAHLAEARAIAPVATVQNHFNIAQRADLALLNACADSGIAFVPFGPIGSGHTDLSKEPLARVAARHDATVSLVALAWLLALSPATLAIPGTGSLAHLEENVRATSIALGPDDLSELASS